MAYDQDTAATEPNPEDPISPLPSHRETKTPAFNDAASVFSNTTTTTTTTSDAHNTSDHTPLLSHNNNHSNLTKPRRPGEAIMNSDDPSTAALRAWAHEKQLQYPGQDGSFAIGGVGTGGNAMGWGSDSWILPRMGEKERRMDAERLERKRDAGVGRGDAGERKDRRLSGLFGRWKGTKNGEKRVGEGGSEGVDSSG